MNMGQPAADLAEHDPLPANAVSQMVGYIQENGQHRIRPKDRLPVAQDGRTLSDGNSSCM